MARTDHPFPLDHAGAWRVYLGGRRIRQLRGQCDAVDDHWPEEWIASEVEAAGAGATPGAGLSRLRDEPNMFLRDEIARDPEGWLGHDFVLRHGMSCGVLLKLLDAAERLNVQLHPTREDARRLWGTRYGKLECWHFLRGRKIEGRPPVFYIGLREGVTRETVRRAFESGDPEQILSCMHCFPAEEGQTVLVEGGVPHAIGAGCFLMEIQEPSDLTLRLERRTASGTEVPDEVCHMGIGYDAMFSLLQSPGISREAARNAWFIPPKMLYCGKEGTVTQLLGYDRCSAFAMEEILARGRIALERRSAFYGLFVLSGRGMLSCGEWRGRLAPGDQIFVPGECPDVELQPETSLRLIRFFGPEV